MDLDKKDLLFAGGVVVVLALIVLFMKGRGGTSASDGNTADMVGGFKTAQTVYVPTTSYDLHYDTNNGTIIHNGNATTYEPPASGGTVSTPTQDPPPSHTTTTGGGSTNPTHTSTPSSNHVPTTMPSTAPIHESQPSPAPQGTNTAPIFTAPSQSNALAQLQALQQTINRESHQMGASHFNNSQDASLLHAQKIELAREAGLSVDADGYIYDANGHKVNIGMNV